MSENRIDQLFRERKDVLSIYFTAGYPNLDDTGSIILGLQEAGANLIEVGIPFSDPVADGETIQKSSQKALENGMTLELLLKQLEAIKNDCSTPIILMGYLNPIIQFGIERFCKRCTEVGVDGLIVPDLPLRELEEHYSEIFETFGLKNVLLITPQTPDERIRLLDKLSTGFNYVVSSASTTGKTGSMSEEQLAYLARIKNMELTNPLMVGFGIYDKKGFDTVCNYADGAIIGSAFIKAISNGDLEVKITEFIKSITE